jgi:hypothetical protein
MEQDNLIKTLLNNTVTEVRLGELLTDTYSINIILTFLFQNDVQKTHKVNEMKLHGNIICLSRPIMFI